MSLRRLQAFTQPLSIAGTRMEISGLRRDGAGDPLVFLHGFGSTKEDYADVVHQEDLSRYPVLAYDAPGCGASTCSDLAAVSVPFLVSVAAELLRAQQMSRYHLIGHSMGGLTALLLADAQRSNVASFVDIEGNLAPEDCFLSRQVVSHPHADPHTFLAEFAERVGGSRYYASTLYAAFLRHKVRADVVKPIFESMVELSDNGGLLQRLLALRAPKMFMYGEQNNTLSYLAQLGQGGVELAEIPASAHFPMYSNPPEMWRRLVEFHAKAQPTTR